MKTTIENMVREMDSMREEDGIEAIIDSMRGWAQDLGAIGVGKRCELEELRTSNGLLRDWGHEMYNDAEYWESQADKMQDKVSELEGKVEDLESELSNVEQH